MCLVMVPIGALGYSLSQEKEYTATAALLFRDPGFDQKLFGSQVFQPSTDPAREAATNLDLVSLDLVAKRTAKQLPHAPSVKDHVAVRGKGQSNVVRVSATYPDRRLAAKVANTFAEQYIALRQQADRAKIAQAQALVKRRLEGLSGGTQASQGRALQDRLDVLSSLQTGNAELAEAAGVPSSPSSPRLVRNTILGALGGLVLGVALAFLLERLDRRLRSPREIEEIFERPVLAAIPDSRALARSGLAQDVLPAAEGESFRMLRANLRYFNVDRAVHSVLVTSAAPGDGKSTVAWNLASTAAGSGARVLLMEADLRHPAIAASLNLRGRSGLSTVLAGEASLEDAIQQIPVQAKATDLGLRTVDVLLAGPLPPNPAELLESNRMREVIEGAERSYDLLVIDTPPASVVADAIPLLTQVGGVIVVGRLTKTTREAAVHLRNQLRNLDARILGVVVNAVGRDSDAYAYGYGYAAYYRDGPDGSARESEASRRDSVL
jgi:capsular exopolysaccharide synthesis family protein